MPKGQRVTNPAPALPGVEAAPSTAFFEQWVVQNANLFTLVYRVDRQNQREEHPTLSAAIAKRADNPRGMIYAVMANGRNVMISPADYPKMLKLRGEQ